ncbi:ribosome maturation factor RimM [Methylocystis bryophila]|uniref:Ribosome maturation factor RimM n=1 Tax=Methylocystis bryophila TaxID=655015 RepID=A0A1W6MZT3_9HYPH|nr:ribosome maturation factor RimM [Methylocystis bryophila]ARN83091.1 16S rRNA processing protein RimM [Methylocystis bryophila]BDV39408.1 ribosome maturation factor RimM [Methylocystis bryophila]
MSETTAKPGNLLLMGRFGAPHGVRGEIRLQSFTAEPLSIADYGPLFDKSGARRFLLESAREQGREMLIVSVKGVADRDAAQKLTGIELYLPRESLPAPEEDEFYLADLIGLAVESEAGVALGRVIALRNFGAGDILEVLPQGGGETQFYPFTKALAPIVDVAGGRVVVMAPREEIDEED